MQNINKIGRFQELVTKNPLAFVAAVFFCMFWITYFINIRKNDDVEEYWRELYIKERAEKDKLHRELLINANIIQKQEEIIKETDSTLRDNTMEEAKQILKSK